MTKASRPPMSQSGVYELSIARLDLLVTRQASYRLNPVQNLRNGWCSRPLKRMQYLHPEEDQSGLASELHNILPVSIAKPMLYSV